MATLNNVEPLIVWSRHLHEVADVVIKAGCRVSKNLRTRCQADKDS